ncbi:MAG: trehalose-6-phosphate synthase [Rhizobiaceae bacterium]|nr:trehalose-6-phosphate synthase [Rhizobiaceae bacterium]
MDASSLGRLVVVSNRIGDLGNPSASGGLVVGIADALADHGGMWLGFGGQFSDEGHDRPVIRRVGGVETVGIALPAQDYSDYYNGFANSVLWPLFHYRLDLVDHRPEFLAAYRRVNDTFAAALSARLRSDDIVWVHDYHLLLLAPALRRLGHSNRIGFFLHIPFPPPDIFLAAPNHEDIIDGLAAFDIVGFQTQTDLDNYRRAVAAMRKQGEPSQQAEPVSAVFPIGIDVEAFAGMANKAADDVQIDSMRRQILGLKQIIGIDRLDYSKGLPNRMQAFARLLELHPDQERSITYLQIASPTREDVDAYADIRGELEAAAGRVNGRHADLTWTPIRYIHRNVPRTRLAGLLKASQVGLVTPLRDGMNLVAKEYVAAQDPSDPGVLVLSRFAGAAEEMQEALIVNPYVTDEVAHAIDTALRMPIDERRSRHGALLRRIEKNDAQAWRNDFLSALSAVGRRSLAST